MNKKNGFTLVELLGVIVVLAILALITIPIISNVINDVRIKALQNSAYGLIEASNLYYAQYGNASNIRFDINDNKVSSSDTDNLINYKGSIKSGTVILDKKGQVTVCITDGKNSAYKNYNEKNITTIKGKVCNIPSNTSIVYLDDDATIDYYDNPKLTELVNELVEKNNILESKIDNIEDNFLDKTYPVGSIYISTTDDTAEKVQNRFGGTWISFGNGRTLLSSTSQSEQIGGTSTATFTPTGTVGNTTLTVNQMPSHNHSLGSDAGCNYGSAIQYLPKITDYYQAGEHFCNNGTTFTGGSQPHTHTFTGTSQTINTMPPYITVFMYKRTA